MEKTELWLNSQEKWESFKKSSEKTWENLAQVLFIFISIVNFSFFLERNKNQIENLLLFLTLQASFIHLLK